MKINRAYEILEEVGVLVAKYSLLQKQVDLTSQSFFDSELTKDVAVNTKTISAITGISPQTICKYFTQGIIEKHPSTNGTTFYAYLNDVLTNSKLINESTNRKHIRKTYKNRYHE
ncbi:MAG: hypothetical protein R3Y26_04155 [Rikenellaceae bacterium]